MPVSVAITRIVKAGCEDEFLKKLRQFFQDSFTAEGVLGASMIVPGGNSNSREFGILRTFATEADREAFYESPLYLQWHESVQPLIEGRPVTRELTGLEAWFRSPNKVPPRWKMAVASLAGVYPTSYFLSLTIAPPINKWPFAASNMVFSAAMVVILTWIVMPPITKVLRPWL